MNKLILGIFSLTLSGSVLANSIPQNNKHLYIGTSFTDGSSINQYTITNNNQTKTGMKNNGLTGADIHLGFAKHAFRIELGFDYFNSRRNYQEFDASANENILKSTSSRSIASLLDSYYDLRFTKNIAAYVGGGAGYLHTFASGTTASQEAGYTSAANNAIINAKAGIDFKVDDSLDAYAEASTIRLVNGHGSMNKKNHLYAFNIGINYTL